MEQKYIIGIIVLILIAIIGGTLFMSGGNTSTRADNELVVSAFVHGSEPEQVTTRCMVGETVENH